MTAPLEFHRLNVGSVDPLTDDAVAITLDVPGDLRDVFRYLPGQHITLRADIDGEDVRRTYSICSNANSSTLRIGVKRLNGGVFSTYATSRLRRGDRLDVIGEVERTEGELARRHYPGNLEAWDLYQRGLWHYRRLSVEDNSKARAFLAQALELDPYFAAAYSRLAAVHYWDISLGWAESPERSLEELLRNARMGVDLDPRDPIGHTYLAAGFSLRGDGERFRAGSRRAVDLNPSSPEALCMLGWALAGSGQADEAISLCQRGLRLSPQGPSAWLAFDVLAFSHVVAGRYSEAIEAGRRATELRPDYLWGYLYLAASFAGLDSPDEARKALEEALRVQPDLSEDLIRRPLAFGARDVVERFIAGLRKAGLEG